MTSVTTLGSTTSRKVVVADKDGSLASAVFFKSTALTASYISRLFQIQLTTDSRDQGWVDNLKAGNWTWFEIAIYADKDATGPRYNGNTPLSWISHYNRLTSSVTARNLGTIFDRGSDLIKNLQPGNILVVTAYARYEGWQNVAEGGVLAASAFTHEWAVESKQATGQTTDVQANVVASAPVKVSATDATRVSKIWFVSPAYDASAGLISSVQLFTVSREQDFVTDPDRGNWSWFEISILDSADATEPLVVDGKTLSWVSHYNVLKSQDFGALDGAVFDKNSDLVKNLKVGRFLGVRVLAQYRAWYNDAKSGRLIVGFTPSK